MRPYLVPLFLGLLLVAIVCTTLQPVSAQPAPQGQTETVKGTITAITDRSFGLEVAEGNRKVAMEFAVQQGIEVHGKVAVGVTATVEYKTTEAGKFQALKVTVEP